MPEPLASHAPGALEGVRVVELAQAQAIPTCGLLLADMGADVIKVEPREGDAFRHNQATIVDAESKSFTVLNRGKRSVCIDVGSPLGREVIYRLIGGADIALVSFKPTDVPRYGLTYEQFAAINPRLVYLEHVPNGRKGPMGDLGGYDVVIQGLSGIGGMMARWKDGAPAYAPPAFIDTGTGFLSALAVVAALRHRDLTGEGQRVETSLLATAMTYGTSTISPFAAVDPPRVEMWKERLAEMRARNAPFEEQASVYRDTLAPAAVISVYFRHYRTKDSFVSVGALSPALFKRFQGTVGVVDPYTNPDFHAGTPEGWDVWQAYIRAAEDAFRTRTTEDWIARLRAVGIPSAQFNFPPEAVDDPQVVDNGYIVELDHPILGPYRTFAPPIRMDRTPTAVRASSPPLGVHTDEVLSQAGYSADEIAALRAMGAVGRLAHEQP
jgi:formyl-CoA transferase